MTRLCKDCVHFSTRFNYNIPVYICGDKRNAFPNYIYGGTDQRDASWLRNLPGQNVCGPTGEWFEPYPWQGSPSAGDSAAG